MKPWSEVEASPEFQALPDVDKSRAQSQYFDEVVVPRLEDPADLEFARDEFFTQFNRSYLPQGTSQPVGEASFNQGMRSLAKVGTGTVEGLAQLGDLAVRTVTPESWEPTLTAPFKGTAEAMESAQQGVEEALPVNPLLQDTTGVKAAGVGGQVTGQLASLYTGSWVSKAPKMLQALGLGQAAALGLESGYEDADRLGITDPWKRDLTAASYAAAEAVPERMFGFGTPGFTRALIGEVQEAMGKGVIKRAAKTTFGEGLEEPITGTLQAATSNILADQDPERPGYARNGARLPSIDPTTGEFWGARGEEAIFGAFGGSIFAGAEFAGSRPRVEQAKKVQQKAQAAIEVLSANPNPTSEDLADLETLQQQEAELGQFISQEERKIESQAPMVQAIDQAAVSASKANMPAAAAAIEQFKMVAASGLATTEGPAMEGQPIEEQTTEPERTAEDAIQIAPTDEVLPSQPGEVGEPRGGRAGVDPFIPGTEDAREGAGPETVTEAPAPVAWEDSPEFAQAEGLAAAGDIEAAEALEATFRERQAQATPPVKTPPAASRIAAAQPPEGLDPHWVRQGRSPSVSERLLKVDLAEQPQEERDAIRQAFGLPDSRPETLAKAIKTLQPQTGGRGTSNYQRDRKTGGRRDAIDDVLEGEDRAARSRLRAPERSLPIKVTMADARQAVQGLRGVLPNIQNARLIEDRTELLEDEEVRRQFVAAERAYDRSLSEEEASDLYDQMMTNPRAEGFTLGGQTFVFLDGVGVRASDKSAAGAVRRVLIHEDAHEAIEAAVATDPALAAEWENLKRQIPQEDLSRLGRTYTRGSGRTDAQYLNDLAHEYFARQMEALERGDIQPDGLLEQFIAWMKKVLSRITGEPEQDITERQIMEFVRAGREVRARQMRQTGQATVRPKPQAVMFQSLRDTMVPDMPEGSAGLITHQSPYPGMTSEKIAAYAWPRFYAAWTSNLEDPDAALTTEQQAQLEADWKANLADENSMEIAADNAFSEERMARMSMDVTDTGPFSTPPEVDNRARFSTRDQDAEYMAAVERGDMEAAQKMVDEAAKKAGYNKGPVFHGTEEASFTEFDPSLRGTGAGTNAAKKAFWFTSSKESAENYPRGKAARVVTAFLKGNFATSDFSNVPSWNTYLGHTKRNEAVQRAIRNGKDGVEFKEMADFGDRATVYAVFDPSQIKSADPVTRDDQGNVIPLSQRFNPQTSDIRFSLRQPEEYTPSQVRADEYKAIIDNPAIPDSMKDYTQFLGSPLKSRRVKQAIAPMVDFARSKMGAFLGDPLEVNAANTERVKELAGQAFSLDPRASRDFADQISSEFRDSGFARVDGQQVHQGSVMAGVLQQEILDYAVRLAAEGDSSLAMQLLPFANDVVAQDHATGSNAGRALQLLSMASRQPGIWTALKGLASGQAEMAQMDPELFQKLRDALFAPQVAQETLSGIEQDIATPEGQKALEGAVESEQDVLDRYTGRAMAMMDEDYRATANAWWATMVELEELLALQQAMGAAPTSAAKQSIAANEADAYRKDPVALQQRIDTLKKQAEKYLKKLAAPKDSPLSQEDRKKLTSDKRIRRAKKAVSADAQAKKMLEALENKPTRQKKDRPAWRKAYEEQIRQPKDKTDFVADLTKQGVEPETAEKLYNEAKKVTRERQDAADARKATTEAVSEARERVRDQKREMGRPARIADQKAFLNDLVRQIFEAPIELQSNPQWRRSVMVEAFKREGFSQGSAENAADYLGSKLDTRLAEAQVKAAQKAAKDLDMKKPTLEKLIKAIRSKAVDPLNADPVTKALAEQAGFAGLTPEQFKRLAELDVQMQGPHQTLRARAARDMLEITLAAKPPKKWTEILTQSWINSALSSLSTLSLSGIHAGFIPVRRVLFDMAGLMGDVALGKTKPQDAAQMAANIMGNLVHAASYMPAVAKYAGLNDTYTQRQIDFINQMHSMQADLQRSAAKLKDPQATAAEKGKAAITMIMSSTDMVRRLLSTADETWGSMLQDFVMRNEAMRQLTQKAKLSPEEVGMIFQSAFNEGRIAGENHRNAGGDSTEATLIERDATQQALLQAVSAAAGQDVAEDVGQTAALEGPMELGNRGAEESPGWDIVNAGAELLKQIAIATRRKNELLGRMISGFVTVPANILNRSAYFTPIGIGRALYKMKGNKAKTAKFYEETMRTEGQQRMRLVEGIAGTLGMIILLALASGDDDEEGLRITGSGPEDKALKEAWLKKGHGQNRIEWVDKKGNVKWAVPYARGGFDQMNLMFTIVGTADDMKLKGLKEQPKNVEYGTMYMGTLLKGLAGQANFFGAKNLASMPVQPTERSIYSNVAYLAAPVIPWSGMTKSLGRLWTGPTDQSSVKSAVLAQLPFTSFTSRPALNALGDQRGPNSADDWSRFNERAMTTVGFPALLNADPRAKDADLYDFMLKRGIAPNAPMRSTLEREQGFLEDAQWEEYLKTRGGLIKQGMRKNLRRLNLLPRKDAQALMERIASEATRTAKDRMKLE
jgi:hypothetical protein